MALKKVLQGLSISLTVIHVFILCVLGYKMWMLWLFPLALHFVSCVDGDSKAVTTTLTTKWPSTPLLLEAR